MSQHICERCGKKFEYSGNVKRCPECRKKCAKCGREVKSYNNLCDRCRYPKRKQKRLVNCKYPDCTNKVRKNSRGSGYCHLHYDKTEHINRIVEYNQKIKKVVDGTRLGDLGLRTDETHYIITICGVCNTPYLASPAALARSKTPCCSPECVGVNAAKNTPNHDTAIEKAIEYALKERGWIYEKQVALAGITIADFYLPEFNVVLYCDGDFWHSDQESKERDAKQVKILECKGYKVFRFSETEINKSTHNCLDKIAKSSKRLFRQLKLPISE